MPATQHHELALSMLLTEPIEHYASLAAGHLSTHGTHPHHLLCDSPRARATKGASQRTVLRARLCMKLLDNTAVKRMWRTLVIGATPRALWLKRIPRRA